MLSEEASAGEAAAGEGGGCFFFCCFGFGRSGSPSGSRPLSSSNSLTAGARASLEAPDSFRERTASACDAMNRT